MISLAHDIVGYDRDETILQGFAAVGVDVDRHFFVARCDDQVAYWHLVVAGVGIGFSQVRVGDAEPLVSCVCGLCYSRPYRSGSQRTPVCAQTRACDGFSIFLPSASRGRVVL